MEHKESWEPLNKQGTTYLDARGNVREGRRFNDSSGSKDAEKLWARLPSTSILTANDGMNEFRRSDEDIKAPGSPTSFMELSDEEVNPHPPQRRQLQPAVPMLLIATMATHRRICTR